MKYQSITQENDLDAFLRTAELAGTEFTAERLTSVQVISGRNNPYILSKEKEQEILERMQTHRDKLTIPRRFVFCRPKFLWMLTFLLDLHGPLI